ncbi:TonB-dependent receptor plug domain-containing protein [Desulfobulbus alkaliphilus]|uniref:TonB-dependent receptor plug domain-containing protein n=1 Tax=Desulfobulbus alkaliphilus TaxID=869814 RepID=UPI0019640DE1|nr:TonB-dependent receptor [Desulfobulbus alkaliphilus]MBM9538440.1 TonB-dependent receptor [Desulfobulbus alkaliphilus]
MMRRQQQTNRTLQLDQPFPWINHASRRRLPAVLLLSLGLFFVLPSPALAHGNSHHHHTSESAVLDTMVVTTDRLGDYIENNPNLVVVLGRQAIQERNMLSVEEALNTMPGVEVNQSSGVGARISIRGSGKSGGVLVLLNGRPLSSSQYGGVDLGGIPIDTIESITVFKPPVPVWLGSGASDGAISIVTRGIVDSQEESQQRATRIRLTGGSFGTIEGNASHQVQLESGTALASFSGKHRDGKRTNSDLDSGSVLLHWDREWADTRLLEVDGQLFVSESGAPGPTDNPTPDARQSYQKASLDSRMSGMAGVTGDFRANLYGEVSTLEDTSQTGLVSTLDSLKFGIKGEHIWNDTTERWVLRSSTILENDALDHTLTGSHDRITAGFGLQADRKWDALTLTSGFRGDRVTGFAFNPAFSGGVLYPLTSGWSLKANIGFSIQVPTFGQLYQSSHGSIDQSRGNPDLDKERIFSSDATLEYRQGRTHFLQITLFRTDTSDPILYQRGDDLIYRPINSDRSWRHGLEMNWKYQPGSTLTMDTSIIIQDSEIVETGKVLPYTPRVRARFTLFSTINRFDTRMEASVRYSGEQYSEIENKEIQRLDDYVTVDLKVIQPLPSKTCAAEWFLNVENLFDSSFEIHHGYPDNGFRIFTGLNLAF